LYGPKFQGGDRIFERLDRALSNDAWRMGFPNAVVKVLTRVSFSDHHPLLIQLFGSGIFQRTKSFKFESAWLLDDSYEDILQSQWSDNAPINEQLLHLTPLLKEWKNISFEKIQSKSEKFWQG
jgi:hypothetical protein